MQQEILKTLLFVFLFTFSTYAISKSFWILGIKGKAQSFTKLWGATSLLLSGIAVAIGLVILSKIYMH